MRIWEIEVSEIERRALSGVFVRYHILAENLNEAKTKAEQKIKNDYEKIKLEITSIEELFEIVIDES